MLIVTKRKYKKRHVVGGSGIFDTVVNFAKRLLTSGAAKALASSAAKQVGKHIVDKMLQAREASAMLQAPAASAMLTPATAATAATAAAPPTMTQKSREDLARLIHQGDAAANINNLMMRGSGVAIQDLVKRLNGGSGMKVI
jgi:hypothetical protein